MLTFHEARARIVESARALPSELVAVEAARGRVLAEPLVAAGPIPAFDCSAMDGYAVRCADVNGTPAAELRVVGTCRAGDAPVPHSPSTALRIFTGAPLPLGADAVIIQENAEREDDVVRFTRPARPYENVRRAGEDLAAGAVALPAGTRVGPFQLGVVAALDRAELRVARRPRVSFITTGDELRPAGSAPQPGKIAESNGAPLRALALEAGADARLEPALGDDLNAARQRFAASFGACDVLVTVGGASVGDYDLVRPALQAAGATLDFWKVAIKPGKPLIFGRAGDTLILGLPGNPVSAQLGFALFGVPLLRALQGDARPLPSPIRVVVQGALSQRPGRLGLYRARLDGDRAFLDDNQSSASTLSLARADVLVLLPADVTHCDAGTTLDALRLSAL